ncbi:Type-1V conjugative transfer system mating pair stabilization [Candidatus Methanoperedenaceae archaeon GB50]|nr:Type-1V conjugative transfer system mating pair stabilization [Candidatus Methanoperedenaceae archaeon GB50]
MGFYARCVYDDNKDPLCPGFLVECQNGECPFTDDQGNPLPCQPYEGGQYCSPFKCNSLVDPANIPEPDEGEENDKKDDGTIDEYGNCLGTIYIFNGQTIFCRDNGIKTLGVDCCADPGGNFLFFKMKCNEQEVQLVEARRHGMAHKVGEFCALKIFGICFQPKQSWCVFKSMLGRIIAEQGRPQIGNGLHGEGFGPSCSPSNPDACWGSAKSPDCRGFTPEEFQRLDFSKIDLTEFYEHIKTRAESDIQQKTQEKAMEQLQHYY